MAGYTWCETTKVPVELCIDNGTPPDPSVRGYRGAIATTYDSLLSEGSNLDLYVLKGLGPWYGLQQRKHETFAPALKGNKVDRDTDFSGLETPHRRG
ncbi:hypothetical protein AB5N19_02809 [Seiridium cardinale]